MIENTCFAALTNSIESAYGKTPPVERWLDRTKELRKELLLKVISLSQHIEDLPKTSYATYAEALLVALKDSSNDVNLNEELESLSTAVRKFARRLEEQGLGDKASGIIASLPRRKIPMMS